TLDHTANKGHDIAHLNSDPPPAPLRDRHAELRMRYLDPTPNEIVKIEGLRVRAASAPVIDKWSGPRELWNKQDTIRHDATRVSDALLALVAAQRPRLRAVQ